MSRLTFVRTRSNKRAELIARNPVFRALGRAPMKTDKQRDLVLAASEAFQSVKNGTANDADRDTLVCMVNVAMIIASKHCESENLDQILRAQDALLAADDRAAQGKNWNFDGAGHEAMRVALIVHQHMVEQFGQAYITDALLTVREMRAAGHVFQRPQPATTAPRWPNC